MYITLGVDENPQFGGQPHLNNIMFMLLMLGVMIIAIAIIFVLGHNEFEVNGHLALNSKNSKTKRHLIYVRNG